MRYIEMNPVRADMAEHPRDYPWLSYGFNALGVTGKNADWLTPHLEYKRLGAMSLKAKAPIGNCSARRFQMRI